MRKVWLAGGLLVWLILPAMATAQESGDVAALDGSEERSGEVASEAGEELVAQDTGGARDFSNLGEYLETQMGEPERSFPYFEHHGYFRFRADNFWNLDLNTQGTSPILPPLEATDRFRDQIPEDRGEFYDAEAEHLSSANLRFRYHPIIHLTSSVRLHLELDLLDNVVLGSTPSGFGPAGPANDTPLVFLNGGQAPANESYTLQDSVRVRQAYAEMEFFGIIRVGRQPDHWGLGILANGGGTWLPGSPVPRPSRDRGQVRNFDCIDCDFGDVADRFLFVTEIKETLHVGFAFDWPSSGTVSYQGNNYFGQALDLSQSDDVVQWVFMAYREFTGPDQEAERERQLVEERAAVIEGGARVVYRTQEVDQGQGSFAPNDLDTAFVPRSATVVVPDLWVRLLMRPAFRQRLRLELEVVGVFGNIENVGAGLPDPNDPAASEREIQQIGVAFESDITLDRLTTGLNAGFATGRTAEGDNARLLSGWGILDVNPITAGDASDREITNFQFDRDYHIDMLMFRELVGGITNAVYFNPFLQYNFFKNDATHDAMGFRLDVLYAFAANAETTPGGESGIGLEFDTLVYYMTDNYILDVSYGLLFPLGAFDGVTGRARIPAVADFWNLPTTYENAVSPDLAHTLQFRMMWAF